MTDAEEQAREDRMRILAAMIQGLMDAMKPLLSEWSALNGASDSQD